MKRFKICFEINEPKLTTIISVLSREANNLNITEIESPTITRSVTNRNRGGTKPMSETRLGIRILEMFSSKNEVKTQDAAADISKEGFAPSSAASTLSGLVAEGKVVRTAPSTYKLA